MGTQELSLHGELVRLEPLGLHHAEALVEAAADRSSFGWASVPDNAASMKEYILSLGAARAAGDTLPFAQVRVRDDRPVGATSLLNFRRRPQGQLYAVEIGGTWLAAVAQRSGVNIEAKFLLMRHAFEELDAGRVDIKTDARNQRARAAISYLGAVFEGVLRQWQPSQAGGEEHLLRDTAMYSVVRDDWPAVCHALAEKVSLKIAALSPAPGALRSSRGTGP